MTDRELFDAMRERVRDLAGQAYRNLDASGASDGKMAPHVARERILKLRSLARQIDALCNYLDALP